MGNAASFGKYTTAKNIIDAYGQGKYLSGKTAIVTGGNSGLGTETVKALASAGCRVILCARSIDDGKAAIAREISVPGVGGYVVDDVSNIIVKKIDLGDLGSIKSFCDDIIATESRIDYAIFNAGVMAVPKLEYCNSGKR